MSCCADECRAASYAKLYHTCYDARAVRPCCAVGILAARCAQVKGAGRVVLIDREDYRLEHARAKVPGVQVGGCLRSDGVDGGGKVDEWMVVQVGGGGKVGGATGKYTLPVCV